MASELKKETIIYRSGINLSGNEVMTIKKSNFKVIDISVGGDAPKDVVKIYQYNGKMRKAKPKTWPNYIVKIGQKWYPNESITEQLLSELGKTIGIQVADTMLVKMEGMIRLCSRHFHSKDERLDHGAEILSRYFDYDDPEWIDDLDNRKELKDVIDIEKVIEAIRSVFEENSQSIMDDFLQMLLFDCFVGNNDRHYYNWGVIMHIERDHPPIFSPIYDTARALYWNNPDKFIIDLQVDKNYKKERIEKYIRNSLPKISIPDNSKCNHFELIGYLYKKGFLQDFHIEFWRNPFILEKVYECIDKKFRKLMIPERIKIIKETLELRLYYLQNAIPDVE